MRIRRSLALVSLPVLALASGGAAHAQDIMINNGLVPPNPENVINAADDYPLGERVYVRNAGCPPGWPGSGDPWDPCPSPGGPTDVAVVTGGNAGRLEAYDSSTVTMSGGHLFGGIGTYDSSSITLSGGDVDFGLSASDLSTIIISGGSGEAASVYASDFSTVIMSGGAWELLRASGNSTVTMSGGYAGNLAAHGSSTVTMSGGELGWELSASDSATVTLSGGVWSFDPCNGWCPMLTARDSSIINIIGSGFAVNGNLVPYGDLTASFGRLTGTLASGNSLEVNFYQGNYGGWATGTIRLVPEPSTAVLVGFGLLGLLAARRRRAG